MIRDMAHQSFLEELRAVRLERDDLAARVQWLESQLETVADGFPEKWRLSRQEKKLMGVLMRANGRIVPHDAMVSAIWGEDEPSDAIRQIKVVVNRCRTKLSSFGVDIKCEHGVGYAAKESRPSALHTAD